MRQALAPEPLVRFDAIVKRFGGTLALDGVTLDLFPGEILALLGENGAGKSTLIKALAGIHMPDAGTITYRGTPYRHLPPKFGQRQPVTFIHQDLGLIEWMSIAENMALALGFPQRRGLINWGAANAKARAALATINCDIDPSTRIAALSRTEKSLVAIARALAVEADVLVLDEPTASLPANEVARLFDALRPLKARGVGMIYVSHRLDEVFQIADRAAVLRDGRLAGISAVHDTSPQLLVRLIVGRNLQKLAVASSVVSTTRLLEVIDFSAGSNAPVCFNIAQGEILGLVGLRGAGQEAVGRALFGALPSRGRAVLGGKPIDLASPRTAVACGVGLIARDRVDESTAQGLSIRENTFLNPRAHRRKALGWLGAKKEARIAAAIGQTVGLRPNAPHLPIEALSGGNQQKVVVGRWLDTDRKLLIAEDPTAGVDVGAKADIYALVALAAQNGLAVLVVSTDFEEIAHLCTRALVFQRGSIVAELSGTSLRTEALIHAASVAPAPVKNVA